MKSIVIYVSKRGTTKESAEKMGNAIKADVIDVNEVKRVNLREYDKVIIGSYLYAGMIPGKMKKFISKNIELLKSKSVNFFVMGVGKPNEMLEIFKKQLPKELLDSDTMISHFGGELRMEKMNFLERFIIKKIQEKEQFNCGINEDAIKEFINGVI